APVDGFDNGGVHLNSGIANKAAYLISEGGSFNGYSFTGIGQQKTEQIFYALLTQNLNPSSNFNDLKIAAIQETESQFGNDSSELATVQTVFESLGLGDDTDNDGLPDSVEDSSGIYNPSQKTSSTGTDPDNPDTDGDGINDGQEVVYYGSNPLLSDTDNDGISDFSEAINNRTDPAVSNISPAGGWGENQIIGGNLDSSNGAFNPEIAIDSNGNITGVWFEALEQGWTVWAGRYHPSIGWHDIQQISSVNGSLLPEVASDQNGNVVVAWLEDINDGTLRSKIKSIKYIPSTGWTKPETVYDGKACVFTDIDATARNGKAVITWQECQDTDSAVYEVQIFSATLDFNAGWNTPTRINSGQCQFSWVDCIPKVAMDNTGNALAVWSAWDNVSNTQAVFYNLYDTNNGWGTQKRLNSGAGNIYNPDVVMDKSGNAIAVWQQYNGKTQQIYYAKYNEGIWQAELALSSDANLIMLYPRIEMNENGQAILAWIQTNGLRYNIYSSLFNPESGWSIPVQLEATQFNRATGAISHSVSINAKGNAIVTWVQWDYHFNRFDVWSKNYFTTTGWGSNKILESSLNSAHFVESAPFYCCVFMPPKPVISNDNVSVALWLQEDGSGGINLLSNATNSPVIDTISPTTGPVGTSGSLIGNNFCYENCGLHISNYPGISVTFNGTPVIDAWVNPTVILFEVPEGATSGPVVVTTQTGSATAPVDFIVQKPPIIEAISPSSGPVGTTGSLSGSNFCYENCGLHISNYPNISVTFNGTPVTDAWILPTVILFYVPEGATSGPVVLTTPAGSATAPVDFLVE
ncbi:MAG TPA: hypothetical protein ENJ41_04445, partial [Oceanospirillales bacterium]|nr:hypothetical protein [Oceanospirillales bacterium]